MKLLLISLTALCFALGICAHRAQRQKQAVLAIAAAGGSIGYSHQFDPNSPFPTIGSGKRYDVKAKPLAPEWLRNAVGEDFFITPERVVFHSEGPPEETRFIDADVLSHLSDLRHLEDLLFLDVDLDNQSIAKLGQLKELRWLTILKSAQAGIGKIAATDFTFLADMPKLKAATLYSCNLGNDDIRFLSSLTQLEELRIDGSASADHAGITDEVVPYISRMKNLAVLVINASRMSEEGINKIRAALPKCTVNVRACPESTGEQ